MLAYQACRRRAAGQPAERAKVQLRGQTKKEVDVTKKEDLMLIHRLFLQQGIS